MTGQLPNGSRWRQIALVVVLIFAAMACTLTNNVAAQIPASVVTETPSPVEDPEPTVTLPSPTERTCLVIAAEALNMRSGPGVAFSVLDWLSPGQELTITQQRDSWAQVIDPTGAAGWVNLTYCTIGE